MAMTQPKLRLRAAMLCLGMVVLSLASAGCGYAPAPRGKLMEAATQAMELWKHGQFESMYGSADRTLEGPMSKAQWADTIKIIESTAGRPVSYRIEGIQSLEPRPLGLLLFPNKRRGVMVSVAFEKAQAKVRFDFWDVNGKMKLCFLNFQQESGGPQGSG